MSRAGLAAILPSKASWPLMDETPAAVLDPGRGRTKTSYLPPMSPDIGPFRVGSRDLLARDGCWPATIEAGAATIRPALSTTLPQACWQARAMAATTA